ncbi:MAG: HAMP domain-containing histidine kinase [Polyangiaceae bacterium]|nr:HAMP domain-containing histidine kinase [Polyangiaceae bacterium]
MRERATRPEEGKSPADVAGQAAPRSERGRESELAAREAAQDERERANDERERSQDQRDADQSRRETAEDERQRLREMFVGILGHDLRNPLSAITMAADVLVRAGDLPQQHAQTAHRIKRSAKRMARMIDQLLDFARTRLDSGIPIEPREVDMNEVARQVVEELELANPGRVVKLVPAVDGKGVWDRDRIVQLLSNLVGNAIQHSDAGAGVAVRLRSDDDAIEIAVHNAGQPIPEDLLPRLFDPFRQGRHAANGLGLGLYIAAQIAFAHRGKIDVVSTAGDGTTFRLSLPRQATAKV